LGFIERLTSIRLSGLESALIVFGGIMLGILLAYIIREKRGNKDD
jgi:hypothetical protein